MIVMISSVSLVWYSMFDSGATPISMACRAPASAVTAPEIAKAATLKVRTGKPMALALASLSRIASRVRPKVESATRWSAANSPRKSAATKA